MNTTVQALNAPTNNINVLNANTANLQAAIHDPSNITMPMQTVGRFGIGSPYRHSTLPALLSGPKMRKPSSWDRWSNDHYNAINDNPVTNPNTSPPALIWATTNDQRYQISPNE